MNLDQIRSLAPDAGTLKRSQALAVGRKWSEVGQDDTFVWGICQGSKGSSYQVIIDSSDHATHCNCPSRTFPCKHALGLLLLQAGGETPFPPTKAPEWAQNWIDKRQQKQAQKVSKKINSPDETDAATERLHKRIRVMKLGLQELEIWLQDILHMGLAELSQQPVGYFEGIAARLVDAKAPGFANLIKSLPGLMLGEGWQRRSLDHIGHIYLLAKAFLKLESWPVDFQEELKNLAGINLRKEILAEQKGFDDTWEVIGKRTEIQDQLEMQRLWLYGHHSKQFAMLLDFSFGGNPSSYNYQPGTAIHGELVYYPGILPQRAHIKLPVSLQAGEGILSPAIPFADFQQVYAEALSLSPFISIFPAWISGVAVYPSGDGIALVSDQRKLIPLHASFQRSWELLAISGGQPVSIFGEWLGNKLLPLGVLSTEDRWINLS